MSPIGALILAAPLVWPIGMMIIAGRSLRAWERSSSGCSVAWPSG